MSETICMDGATSAIRAERPTPNLRWHNGVLQQQVEVTDYDNGRIVDGSVEWREVPTEPSALSAPAPQGIGRGSWGMEARDHIQRLVNLLAPDQGESASEAFGLALRLQALLPTEPPAQGEPRP